MAFLKQIPMVIMFMFLRSYSADSNMEESHFPHTHPSLKKLIEPLSYDIKLGLPSEEDDDIFSGRTTYLFIIENPTWKIYFNANGLTIMQTSSLVRIPYERRYWIENYHYSNETETSILDFETVVPSGVYNMTFSFSGDISEKEIGVYRTSCKDCNGASKWIFTTQLKPTAARRVFPCWDDPSLKARFALEITHHRNYTVLSNMPIKLQGIQSDDMMWTQFHPTPPIPIYLVAFSLTKFVCNDREADVITTRLCCRQLIKHQTEFALRTSVQVMTYLKWYMDISPQLSSITNIGLPDFPYDVTGNWGLNIYRESHLIYDETLHSIDKSLDVSMYVASMMALQWFGNLVSPTWWTHMLFFQTLALFYGAKAAAETYSDDDIKFMFTYRLQSLAREENPVQMASKMDLIMDIHTLDESEIFIKSNHFTNCLRGHVIYNTLMKLQDFIRYEVWSINIINIMWNISEYAIMVMLEYAVTEAIFQTAAIKYIGKYQFSSATPDDFWATLDDEINETVQQSFYYPSIIEIVHNWLKQRSLPVITVEREEFDDVIIRSKNVDVIKNDDKLLIHINYVTMSNPENVTGFTWLERHDSIIVSRIPISDWVIVNWKQAGYYRVKYSSWIWRCLTTYLNSTDYAKIHVLSRAQIIDNAHYFWSRKELSTRRFVALIRFMGREKQCAPWYAIQNVIQKMWTFLNIDVGKPLRGVILNILEQLLQETGYTEHPGDTECVKFKRLLATKWACRLFHEECLAIAKQRLIEHLKDPKGHIIPPIWEEWTYCNGLVRSNMSTWTRVSREFMETKNMRILEYLGCCGDTTVIIRYLIRLTSDDPLVFNDFGLNVEGRQNIYRSTVEKNIKKNEVFDYVMQKLLKMDFNDEPFVKELSYIVERVYSSTQMDKIKSVIEVEFANNPERYRNWFAPIIENKILQIHELEQLAN